MWRLCERTGRSNQKQIVQQAPVVFEVTGPNMAVRRRRTMSGTVPHLTLLADYLALVYHEARNVRHLIHAGFIDSGPWTRLISLPVNREKAWRELQSIRAAARKAQPPRDVLSAFERRFEISLQQLIELYGHQAWRGGAHGGNAWKGIAQLVGDAVEYLEAKMGNPTSRFSGPGARAARTPSAERERYAHLV